MRRSPLVLPALGLLLLAGCSSQPDPVPQQEVGLCVPPGSDAASTDSFPVEFRQDGKVVASMSVVAGVAVSARVPTGKVEVYVDGRYYGEGETAAPAEDDDADTSPVGGFSLCGPGCPDVPSSTPA